MTGNVLLCPYLAVYHKLCLYYGTRLYYRFWLRSLKRPVSLRSEQQTDPIHHARWVAIRFQFPGQQRSGQLSGFSTMTGNSLHFFCTRTGTSPLFLHWNINLTRYSLYSFGARVLFLSPHFFKVAANRPCGPILPCPGGSSRLPIRNRYRYLAPHASGSPDIRVVTLGLVSN